MNKSAKQSGRLARFYGRGGGRARVRRWRMHRQGRKP